MILGRQAKELGFVRDTYEKVCRLTEILKFFENDDLLGKSLALKGGTAINLTIFNLPRLSVDIDLDFSENVPRDDMLASGSSISGRIAKYMTANAAGMRDNIKVEINYLLRCHVLEVEQRRFESTWQPAGLFVLSVAPIEVFASKIVALLNRTAARDLYDVHNLVRFGLFDESEEILLRKCVVYYSAIASQSPPSSFELNSIDQVSQNRIKTDLYPVLRNREQFNLQAAQSQVKTRLEALLTLEDNEWKFLEAFRDKNYRPDLLFDSGEILERIKNHPMALWKCSQHP